MKFFIILLTLSFGAHVNGVDIYGSVNSNTAIFKSQKNGRETSVDYMGNPPLSYVVKFNLENYNKASPDDWIPMLSDKRLIQKKFITLLENFGEVDASKYFKGCFVYDFADDGFAYFKSQMDGSVLIYESYYEDLKLEEGRSWPEGKLRSTGSLWKYKNMAVIKNGFGSYVLHSPINNDEKLSILYDREYNKQGLFTMIDCSKISNFN